MDTGLNAVETFRASIQHLKNVFLLENTSVTIDDVEFFGCTLWPDYKQANPAVLEYAQNVDENVRRVGVDVSMVQERQRQSVQSLRALVPNRKRIIITHYAPSCLSITDDFQCDEPLMQYLCYSEITDVVVLLNPIAWVHGHMHYTINYKIGDVDVLCNPRGNRFVSNKHFSSKYLYTVQC